MASSSQEKMPTEGLEVAHSEKGTGADSKPGFRSPDDFGFTPAEQRKIKNRIDRRLVLTVGAMYCVSLMDRTNLSAANIAGMSKDLVLIGERYVSILFTLPPFPFRKKGGRGHVCLYLFFIEHHLSRLLHHLCRFPAALHSHRAENRTKDPSFRYHPALGRVHGWDGVRE